MRAAFTVLLCLVSMSIAQNYEYKPDPNWRAPDSAVSRPNPLASRRRRHPGGRSCFYATAWNATGRKEPGLSKSTLLTCNCQPCSNRLMAFSSGRSPTAILIAACRPSANCPICNAGRLCSSCVRYPSNQAAVNNSTTPV